MNGKDMVKLRKARSRRRSPVIPVRNANGEMGDKSITSYVKLVLAQRSRMGDYPYRWQPGQGVTKYDPKIMPVQAYGILSEGKSIHSVLAEFGITQATLMEWVQTYSEFREACEVGYMLGYEWWLEVGRQNLCNPRFNNSLYESQMRNRFRWLEKLGAPDASGGNISFNIVQGMMGGQGEGATKKVAALEKLSTEDLERLQSILVTAEAC